MNRFGWIKRLIIALSCVGVGCALSAQDAAPAARVIEIDKAGVLDQPGATYVLTKDVTAARTAFMIKGDDITLDLNGHTVTYGTDIGVDYCVGVFIRPTGGEESFKGVPPEGFGGGSRFTVKNGTIVEGQQPVAPEGAITYSGGRMVKEVGDHPRSGRFCHAIYIRGCDGFKVLNTITRVNGRDSNNIQVLYSGRGEIANNHCISTVTEVTDRHWPGTQLINVSVGGHMNIHHNVLDGGCQWGINVSGGGETGHLVEVHHNVIRHRSRTTNGYAIGCHAPNMRVYANVVKSVGRGIHLTGNSIDFYNNIVMPREMPNPEYPQTRTHGIKLEGPSHSLVHHNFCRVVADEGFGDADPLDIDAPRYSANMVYKNTFEAIRTTDKLTAYSTNVIRAIEPNFTVVRDNIFRTNQWHFHGDWGGAMGVLFERNRYEVVGEPADYAFFNIRQSSAAETRDMTWRDNVLVAPADYRKVRLLYANQYTRGNVDLAIQWTVNVTAVDPSGLGVGGVTVVATDSKDERVAEAVTDGEGKASLVLTDYHVIGSQGKDPILQYGPYSLALTKGGQEFKRMQVDPTETTNVAVTITDPKRKLYVNAGPDLRFEKGETAKLDGKVVVVGDANAKPEITWSIVRGKADWPIADANAAKTTAAMKDNGECSLQLEAKLGEEVAKDTVKIRTDTYVTPTAVANGPKTAKINTIVQLDGSESKDPRGFPKDQCGYLWKQTAGLETPLSSPELRDPIFYPEKAGTYTFELVFSNPLRSSQPVTCTVEVTE